MEVPKVLGTPNAGAGKRENIGDMNGGKAAPIGGGNDGKAAPIGDGIGVGIGVIGVGIDEPDGPVPAAAPAVESPGMFIAARVACVICSSIAKCWRRKLVGGTIARGRRRSRRRLRWYLIV